jgi:hypothetical protein
MPSHLFNEVYRFQDGRTSLHLASMYGHLECARVLVERGAVVKAKDKARAMTCSSLPALPCPAATRFQYAVLTCCFVYRNRRALGWQHAN